MSKAIVIIHFQPLELYPPVMNLIRYIDENYRDKTIEVVSTKKPNFTPGDFILTNVGLSISRFGSILHQQSSLFRILNYLIFYISAFYRLIVMRPQKIMYYETLSAFPVYFYKKYINRSVLVYIHYHEYTSISEYEQGMRLARYFHKKEEYLYKTARWISHTNRDRMNLFLIDQRLQDGKQFHILPNYPPHSWQKDKLINSDYPVKMVYIGAVGMNSMFTREFADWVVRQNGKVTWDIYSNNISTEANFFLKNLESEWINVKNGVDYYQLPSILEQYVIGIILYNGHIPNYEFNAPNKLFEYLACGLDVWVSDEVVGCAPYYTRNVYPKVLPVNFKMSDFINLDIALDRTGMTNRASPYYYESVYPKICNELFNE